MVRENKRKKKKKLSPLNNDSMIKKKRKVSVSRGFPSIHDPRQLKIFLKKSEKFIEAFYN